MSPRTLTYTPGQRLALILVPPLASALIRLLGLTLRYQDVTDPATTPGDQLPGPSIYVFWHRSLLVCAHRFRHRDIAILISQSFDGELIARTVERLGFLAVRGSSSRAGASGLRSLARAYTHDRRICAITADGPRGPSMIAKPGAVQLAHIVGAPHIGAFYALPLRTWQLRSWDRFLIPKPFSRVLVTWPALVSADLSPAGSTSLQAAIQTALDRSVALAHQGDPPVKLTSVRVQDFHFDLPDDLIAQTPPELRGNSRMLVLDRASGALNDHLFLHLPSHLRPGDLLILNNSRVLPARLFAHRAGLRTQTSSPGPTGRIEVLLTEDLSPHHPGQIIWRALVRPSRKVQPGERLLFHAPEDFHAPENPASNTPGIPLLEADVLTTGDFGERILRFHPTPNFLERIEQLGHMPLPPYIRRDKLAPDTSEDRSRYQTVYAQPPTPGQPRSAAAPTAGLHFTPEVLSALLDRGVEIQYLTLHVGLGTFQPVRVEHLADIRLHAELYTLPAATAEAINHARREGRRIIAVGTTTTRTLEHVARLALAADPAGPLELHPHSGTTSIFLSPGHRFHVVSGLLTNFHLPESTLLMLVSAFAGTEAVLAAYDHAVRARYRFFSYGDCMLIL